ncbi:uncharacterized protein LOC100877763 [Megachile rotundata]|uniref:uncharacterized protein LOC100877763 n=1 Tax=Megachile rotundata TaxID=143995 RepID=UPI003FD592F5
MYIRLSIIHDISRNFIKLYTLFLLLLVCTKQSYCWYNYYDWDISELGVNVSTPEECARPCRNNEAPKICYYKFHIAYYTTVGPACDEKAFLSQCIYGDGFEKTVLPINRQIPGPKIEVCKNDRIIVDVENAASGVEISIHWHGLYQNGFQYYDGVPYVTQCPIHSSSTFRYDFVAQNPGTHFYHSHISTHMLDGQYGPLIIKPPLNQEPFLNLYDKDEHIMVLSDWMHELSLERFPGRYRHNLGQFADNILINGLGHSKVFHLQAPLATFTVTKGKRYRMRIINAFTTVCLAELRIQDHDFLVIAQDGANVRPKKVNAIVTAAGERVDVILNANKPVDTYWIQVRGLGECQNTKVQQLAMLQYRNGPSKPSKPAPTYDQEPTGVIYNSEDSTKCNTKDTSKSVCVNQFESIEEDDRDLYKIEPDERHIMNLWFYNYTEYGNYPLFAPNSTRPFFSATDKSQIVSMFNDITFEPPASPFISQPRNTYQAMCKRNQPSTCTEPCTCAEVIHTKLNNVVELVIYDAVPQDDIHHPMHLHGYHFKVFSVGQFTDGRNLSRSDMNAVVRQHTQRLQRGEYRNVPLKDNVKVPLRGYVILRFKANNPGWWLIHCHFTWHHITGMELIIHVGDQGDLPPPPPGFPKCSNWKPPLLALHEFYGFGHPDYYYFHQ